MWGNWCEISELAKLICLSVNLELFSILLLSSKVRELCQNCTHTSVKFTVDLIVTLLSESLIVMKFTNLSSTSPSTWVWFPAGGKGCVEAVEELNSSHLTCLAWEYSLFVTSRVHFCHRVESDNKVVMEFDAASLASSIIEQVIITSTLNASRKNFLTFCSSVSEPLKVSLCTWNFHASFLWVSAISSSSCNSTPECSTSS